jgi:K+-sensing histidine kinase KdpD
MAHSVKWTLVSAEGTSVMPPPSASVTAAEDSANTHANLQWDGELNAIGRVMVCVRPQTFVPELIQAGAETARGLRARWYVVCVETPEKTKKRTTVRNVDELVQNIRLAETLGATVVRVKAERPADGLIRFAEREGVTHLIFEQTPRVRRGLLPHASTKDRLLSELKGVSVLELRSGHAVDVTTQRNRLLPRPSPWWWAGIAIFGVMVVFGAPAILWLAVAVVLAALWSRSLDQS